jgi:WD40 repeat protein
LAVKLQLAKSFTDPRAVERFVAEAQTWVSLGLHPNVCTCHYVRVLDGFPMLFAEYVPGGTLRGRIDDGSLYRGEHDQVTARLVRIASQVARGLEHSHASGVLHRDVKPANVLLDNGDDGAAKITDFGLAAARAAASGTSNLGGMTLAGPGGGFMTPAYASPEQVVGGSVGRRSDIYSAAVSMLEMFAGIVRPGGPAAGATPTNLLDRGPARPDVPPMPPAVASLLARCLQTKPESRPGSMTEVAEELEALLATLDPDGYTLVSPAAVELRAAEHNNRALSLLDLGARAEAEAEFQSALNSDPQHLGAVYNTGLLRWRNAQITDEDLLTQIQAARERAGDPWQARCLLAQVHLERGDLYSARDLLEALAHEHPSEPEVQAARRELKSERRVGPSEVLEATSTLTSARPPRPQRPGNAPAKYTDVSADGRLGILHSPGDPTIRVFDVATDRCLHEISFRRDGSGRPMKAEDVRLTPDARSVSAVLPDGEALICDLDADAVRMQVGGLGEDTRLTVSPDGSHLLVYSCDWDVHEFRVVHIDLDKKQHRILATLRAPARAMTFTPDAGAAVVASDDHHIRVWNLATGECRYQLTSAAGNDARALAFSHDGRLLVSHGDSTTARLWDLESGRCLRTLRGHVPAVGDVWISPDGRCVYSMDDNGTVASWSLASAAGYHAPLQLSRPRPVAELRRHTEEARELVSQAQQAIVAGDYGAGHRLLTRARLIPGYERNPRVLRAWRNLGQHLPRVGIRGWWTTRVLAGQGEWLLYGGRGRAVSVSADGRVAASARGTRALLWDLEAGAVLRELPVSQIVDGVELSADGQRVVCAADFGRVRVWSMRTGEQLYALDLPYTAVPGTDDGVSVAFTADGRRVLLGNEDGTLLRWDLESGRCLRTPTGHERVVKAVWAAADGATCASVAWDSVRVWDLNNGECLRELAVEREHPPYSVCLSADGRLVVTTWPGESGVLLWNTADNQVQELGGAQHDSVLTARFSPDGRFVFTGNQDGTITVWDTGTGDHVNTLTGHRAGVWDIRLTPDGRHALSGSSDGTIRLWELDWDLTVANTGSAGRAGRQPAGESVDNHELTLRGRDGDGL